MLKHYVEILYPGTFMSESTTKEVYSRNPESITLPKGAYGFRFIDREEVETTEETLKGEIKNVSVWYYKGREITLEEVKKEMPEKDILISNMEINNWNRVLLTEFNQAIALNDGDIVMK